MVFVVGRFPPPVDGQTLATERLASLLEDDVQLHRVDTEPSTDSVQGPLRRTIHFYRIAPQIRSSLAQDPGGTVLWTSISPDPLGHVRDLAIVYPAFQSQRQTFAVIHRGNFRKLFESRITTSTARRLVTRVQAFVFLTHHLAEECERWIPDSKRVVIPNTIDDDIVFSDREVKAKQTDRKQRKILRVIFVGHMLRSKGYLDVLDALRRLLQSGLEIEGHFVGPWRSRSDKAHFEDLLASMRLTNAIVHHGSISDRTTLKTLYKRMDILALPTYYANEAQPLVILEAFNAGIPVVSTNHAGIPEMIRDGSEGVLVPARNADVVADAIRRMSTFDAWIRFSEAARQRFLDCYSPDIVRRLWRALVRA